MLASFEQIDAPCTEFEENQCLLPSYCITYVSLHNHRLHTNPDTSIQLLAVKSNSIDFMCVIYSFLSKIQVILILQLHIFTIHLDIHYIEVYIYSKYYELKKTKMAYILEWREQIATDVSVIIGYDIYLNVERPQELSASHLLT